MSLLGILRALYFGPTWGLDDDDDQDEADLNEALQQLARTNLTKE